MTVYSVLIPRKLTRQEQEERASGLSESHFYSGNALEYTAYIRHAVLSDQNYETSKRSNVTTKPTCRSESIFQLELALLSSLRCFKALLVDSLPLLTSPDPTPPDKSQFMSGFGWSAC